MPYENQPTQISNQDSNQPEQEQEQEQKQKQEQNKTVFNDPNTYLKALEHLNEDRKNGYHGTP